jgi:ABC-type phosphate/phosphonate transport system ATPase subunit
MQKITIIGQQCAGKTTVANIINKLVCRPTILKFAGPIYGTLKALGVYKKRRFMQEFSDVAKNTLAMMCL